MRLFGAFDISFFAFSSSPLSTISWITPTLISLLAHSCYEFLLCYRSCQSLSSTRSVKRQDATHKESKSDSERARARGRETRQTHGRKVSQEGKRRTDSLYRARTGSNSGFGAGCIAGLRAVSTICSCTRLTILKPAQESLDLGGF